MTIWDQMQTALSGLGVPVVSDEYIAASGTSLPDVYIRHFLVSEPLLLFADNLEIAREFTVQVTVYSRIGLTDLPDVIGAMTAAGFVHGVDIQLPYEPSTRRYGLAMEFTILQETLL